MFLVRACSKFCFHRQIYITNHNNILLCVCVCVLFRNLHLFSRRQQPTVLLCVLVLRFLDLWNWRFPSHPLRRNRRHRKNNTRANEKIGTVINTGRVLYAGKHNNPISYRKNYGSPYSDRWCSVFVFLSSSVLAIQRCRTLEGVRSKLSRPPQKNDANGPRHGGWSRNLCT